MFVRDGQPWWELERLSRLQEFSGRGLDLAGLALVTLWLVWGAGVHYRLAAVAPHRRTPRQRRLLRLVPRCSLPVLGMAVAVPLAFGTRVGLTAAVLILAAVLAWAVGGCWLFFTTPEQDGGRGAH